MSTFGEHIRERRLGLGLSLRAFCLKYDEDPSNWSKIERGVNRPPAGSERKLMIGRHLEYADDSPEMRELFTMASVERGNIPAEILDDKPLMKKLPLIFRMLQEDPDEAELMRLVDIIREAHTPDEE